MVQVASGVSRDQAAALDRVLTNRQIVHQIDYRRGRATIWVAAPHAPFARRQLARQAARAIEDGGVAGSSQQQLVIWSSLIIAGGLALLHLLISLEPDRSLFFEAYGAMDRRIRSGELYRCVTALLLHTTPAHLLSNVAALILFGPFVCRRFGHGWGWLMVLLSGMGGNYLNAWVRNAPHLVMGPHLSVGASTAVFGALGILVSANLYRKRLAGDANWRRWAPVAGGLGFLAFMGSAPGTDLLAHLFGLLVGLGIGAAAAFSGRPAASVWGQAMATGAALAIMLWAWSQGLGHT